MMNLKSDVRKYKFNWFRFNGWLLFFDCRFRRHWKDLIRELNKLLRNKRLPELICIYVYLSNF